MVLVFYQVLSPFQRTSIVIHGCNYLCHGTSTTINPYQVSLKISAQPLHGFIDAFFIGTITVLRLWFGVGQQPPSLFSCYMHVIDGNSFTGSEYACNLNLELQMHHPIVRSCGGIQYTNCCLYVKSWGGFRFVHDNDVNGPHILSIGPDQILF